MPVTRTSTTNNRELSREDRVSLALSDSQQSRHSSNNRAGGPGVEIQSSGTSSIMSRPFRDSEGSDIEDSRPGIIID